MFLVYSRQQLVCEYNMESKMVSSKYSSQIHVSKTCPRPLHFFEIDRRSVTFCENLIFNLLREVSILSCAAIFCAIETRTICTLQWYIPDGVDVEIAHKANCSVVLQVGFTLIKALHACMLRNVFTQSVNERCLRSNWGNYFWQRKMSRRSYLVVISKLRMSTYACRWQVAWPAIVSAFLLMITLQIYVDVVRLRNFKSRVFHLRHFFPLLSNQFSDLIEFDNRLPDGSLTAAGRRLKVIPVGVFS
jgi:hypothetical protein